MRIVIIWIGLLLAGCARTQNGTPPSESVPDLVILNGTLIDGSGAPARPATMIEIRDGNISNVVLEGEPAVDVGVRVIDASGRYIIPGLADMHVHLGSGGNVSLQPSQVLPQFVYYGVTSILSLGGTGGSAASINELRSRSSAGEIVAPHIYATGEAITIPGSHPVGTFRHLPQGADPDTYDWSEQGLAVVDSVAEAREAVRANLAAGMNAIKIFVESGPDPFGDDHPQMPLEMIEAVVDEARKGGLPVLAHVSSIDEVEDSLRGGVDALAHGVIGPPPEASHWEQMRAQDVFLIPTLSIAAPVISDHWNATALTDPFLLSGVGQDVADSLSDYEPPADIPAPVKKQYWAGLLASQLDAHRHQVKIALGTDTNMPFVFPGHSVHEELEHLVEAGLSPNQALTAATLHAAELLDRKDEFGTIEEGKRADILILSANPLEDISNTRTIETVILEGAVVDRDSLIATD